MKEIESFAFHYSGLKEINLPENLQYIGESAFTSCKLTNLEIPSSVEFIGNNILPGDNDRLKDITVNWEEPKEFGPIFNEDLKNITLHVPVGTAPKYEATTTWSCFNIQEGKYEEKYVYVNDIRYVLKYPAMTATVVAPESSEQHYRFNTVELTSTIENEGESFTLIEIGPSAFESSDISSIYIPKTVQIIAERGFNGSTLEKIEIEENSVLRELGRYSFAGCNKLEAFPICNNLEKISLGSFYQCSALSEFFIPSSISTLESLSFDSNVKTVHVYWNEPKEFDPTVFDAVEEKTLYVPKGTKEKYELAIPWKYFGNIIETEETAVEIVIDPNATVDVYNMQGILLKRCCSQEEVKQMHSGLYILRQGDKASTVYIKK